MDWFGKFVKYVESVFSADSCASFGRWATAFTILVASVCLMYVTQRTHDLPDPLKLGALTAFATCPYIINKYFSKDYQAPSEPKDEH